MHKIDPYSLADIADRMPKVKPLPSSEEPEIVDVKDIGEKDQGKTREIELTIDLPVRDAEHLDAHFSQ